MRTDSSGDIGYSGKFQNILLVSGNRFNFINASRFSLSEMLVFFEEGLG